MTHRLAAAVAALAIGAAAPAWAQPDEAAANALLEAWAAAFNECSAPKLAALYDPAATLWGTNSSALVAAPQGVRAYFDGACALQPPVTVNLGERITRVFGSAAASAGSYTFVREGRSLPARFSMGLVVRDGQWRIVQHHSSMLPGRP